MPDNTRITAKNNPGDNNERLQNVLAQRGVASRRGAADIIKSGAVTVNGARIIQPGHRVDIKRDTVRVDGVALDPQCERKRTILLYKPRGLICSAANSQGTTVCDLLRQQIPEKLVPVGRLDKDSEGLLIMSNDGELTNILTHPRYGHKKTYNVWVRGTMNKSKLDTLQSRMEIDGYVIKPAQVKIIKINPHDNTVKLAFTLREGRNRQIRKMCELADLRVISLQRIRIGSLRIGRMKPGDWRELHENDITTLKHQANCVDSKDHK